MKFPNKVTSYNESIISKFPKVLSLLDNKNLSPKNIYEKMTSNISDIGEFIEILDCLYILNKIQFDEKDNVLELC